MEKTKKYLIEKIISKFNEERKKTKENNKIEKYENKHTEIKILIKKKIIFEKTFRLEIREFFNKINHKIRFSVVTFNPHNNFEAYLKQEIREEKFNEIDYDQLIDDYNPENYSCNSFNFDYDYSSSEEDNELITKKKFSRKAFIIFMKISKVRKTKKSNGNWES